MSIIYVVKVEIDPVDEYTWDEWYTRLHLPQVLEQPGFLRATKYKIDTPEGEWSQHLILYEVESRELLDAYLNGEAVVRLRADHYEHFGSSTHLSRLILTPTATVERAAGRAA